MLSFKEWTIKREFATFNEAVDIETITLYHGSTLVHVQNIIKNGIRSPEEYGVSEFWATTDANKAKMFAQVQTDVEDIYNPPPLGVFSFDIPKAVMKILKRNNGYYSPEPGIYEFGPGSFEHLNEYARNKRVQEFKMPVQQPAFA